MKIETLRMVSGFRIHLLPKEQQQKAWSALAETVGDGPYLEIMRLILGEPWYVDDAMRHMSAGELLAYVLDRGELFAHFVGNNLMGISILRDIMPEREATWDSWAHPEYRGHHAIFTGANHLIKYAFAPYSDKGLGVKKIKAHVASANTSAIKALSVLKFYMFGRSPADGLFFGNVTDMLLCELPNPQFFNLGDASYGNGGSKTANGTDGATVQPGASVPDAAGSGGSGSASDVSGQDNRDDKPARRVRPQRNNNQRQGQGKDKVRNRQDSAAKPAVDKRNKSRRSAKS